MMAGSYAKRLKRKQRRQAERLEAILDAACALVTERPISRISTEGIARRATLPLGVVYNLFGSKEQVIRNLLLRTQDNLFDDLEALIMSVDDPAEQIHLMVSRYLEFFDRYSTPLRFYYNSTAAPGLEVRREFPTRSFLPWSSPRVWSSRMRSRTHMSVWTGSSICTVPASADLRPDHGCTSGRIHE
jgi:AcrR family transcriptional regulator